MRLVDLFRDASGLGINIDKTNIISARYNSSLSTYVSSCPWPDVKTPDMAIYLGILFGRMVTAADVFNVPITRLVDRMSSMITTIKGLSHAKRVLAYNVFIVTLISYHIKFFHLPYTIASTGGAEGIIQTEARRLIRYHNGSAYSYVFLISPLDRVGPSPPPH